MAAATGEAAAAGVLPTEPSSVTLTITWADDDNLYNVAHLFWHDGTIAKQYKIHITPNEKKWWGVQSGAKVEVFATDRGRIAIVICYDVEFPELVRIANTHTENV